VSRGTGAQILWEKGIALFSKERYDDARHYFQRIISTYPKAPEAADASFYNAECFFLENHFKEAADAYRQFYEDYPADPRAKQAEQKEAICVKKQKSS
jgi:TolA-binding protein